MTIRANIARAIERAKLEKDKTLAEISDELDIPLSSLKGYASGRSNPRADTIEDLASKFDMTLVELVSDPPEGLEQAETVLHTAKEFSGLTPEKRAKGIRLFQELIDLFSEIDPAEG